MAVEERHLRVQRTARYYEIGTAGAETRDVWICCHGYGQLAEPFARALESLASDHRVVLAPEALSRFYLDEPAKRHGPETPVGASWMTRVDRNNEIADYVEYLDTLASTMRGKAPSARIIALGFSQGVATACRWVALGKTKIDALVMWGGPLPADLPAAKGAGVFQNATLVMVAGRADQVVPVHAVDREHRALADRGLRAELVIHEGGHSLNGETLRRVAGIVSSGA